MFSAAKLHFFKFWSHSYIFILIFLRFNDNFVVSKRNIMFRKISRIVWILSLVSLFTDMASEMLYPIMPIYLESIGFSVVFIGILEGFAEATAGLSKGYFGKLSDLQGKRVPFVRLGYTFSAISKPLLALFQHPLWIFSARTLDRLGKGLRTGARDAMLSAEATENTKGTVFGFHRSMDTLGAVLGPLIALLFLYFYPGQYILLFYLAFLPGIMAIAATFFLREQNKKSNVKAPARNAFFSFLKYWKESPKDYRRLSIGILFFTLFNSSDLFLILKIKQAGIDDTLVIGTYIFYNLIYALFSFPIGILADKIGLKRIFLAGLAIFSLVYWGMAFANSMFLFLCLFFFYGIYAASTEGIIKAWISNLVDKKDTATAIGTLTGFQSICSLIASPLAGLLWYRFGPEAAFISTAVVSLAIMFYLWFVPISNSKKSL